MRSMDRRLKKGEKKKGEGKKPKPGWQETISGLEKDIGSWRTEKTKEIKLQCW